MSGIEIYIRHNSNGAMLNIQLDAPMKQRLLAALQVGHFNSQNTPVNLEISVLPEWFTTPNSTHVRIPITSINVNENN